MVLYLNQLVVLVLVFDGSILKPVSRTSTSMQWCYAVSRTTTSICCRSRFVDMIRMCESLRLALFQHHSAVGVIMYFFTICRYLLEKKTELLYRKSKDKYSKNENWNWRLRS